MLPEIIRPRSGLSFLSVAAVTELSESLGFYHLIRKTGSGAPGDRVDHSKVCHHRAGAQGARGRAQERKSERSGATDVHAEESGPAAKSGIGLTDLNRRQLQPTRKTRPRSPMRTDVRAFIARVAPLNPRILAFVMREEDFVGTFKKPFPVVD